ncbi:OmpA family protein [Janibacter hoylei]|uniref:OmpA family protein n=1 Tax=Janibacter hoylei TaxID=364298 RepID=UPI0024902067|nr:OmpA family protein [Janibacter hoylei]
MSTTAWLLAAALTLGTGAASDGPDDLPEPRQELIDESVHTWTDEHIERSVRTWSVDDSVQPLVDTLTSGSTTTVTLLSDILFNFGTAKVDATARTAVEESAQSIPKGAKVTVEGHTDSIGSPSDNRTLSLRRAQAVAKVLADERPDLKLTVRGLGESQPVADNTSGGEDNPAGRQKNRRVEISHRS